MHVGGQGGMAGVGVSKNHVQVKGGGGWAKIKEGIFYITPAPPLPPDK